jgi:hypothetical protein
MKPINQLKKIKIKYLKTHKKAKKILQDIILKAEYKVQIIVFSKN